MSAVSVEPESAKGWLRETLEQSLRISRSVFAAMRRPQILVTVILVNVLVGSALGVIYSSYVSRQLFDNLAKVQEARDEYEREWTQLLLEQGTLSAYSAVELEATSKFSMRVPEGSDMVVIQSP